MLQHVITQNDGELTVSVDTGAVSGTASQGFYVTSDGEVECAIDGTITHYINGLPFDTNGRLVISTDTVFAYSNGIPVTSTGAVALSADAATYYNNGIPFAGGALAASGLYGPELAEAVDSATGWLLQNGASFTGGDLIFAGTGWALAQRSQPFESGKTYKIEAVFSEVSGGLLAFGVRNAANSGFLEQSDSVGDGTHSLTVTVDGDDNFLRFWAASTTTAAIISTFSIKEVL